MSPQFYEVPPLEDSILELSNETIIGVNDILGEGGGIIGDEILGKALAIRVRNSTSCIVRLANLGFVHEAYILLRSVTEATILFHEALKKYGFKNIYSLEESERVFQLLKKQKLIDDRSDTQATKELESQYEKAKEALKSVRDKRYKLPELAEKNGCLFEYVHYYGLGSAYVHCLPNVIRTYFNVLPGNAIEWDNTPELGDRVKVVAGALQCYAKIGINWAEVRCGIEIKDKAYAIYRKLEETLNSGEKKV